MTPDPGHHAGDGLRIAFVGDVGLGGRVVGSLREALAGAEPPSFVTELLEADLAFCNLELPFCDDPAACEVRTVADAADADLLSRLGIKLVSLANNHICDAGHDGIRVTRQELERLGIAAAGAGSDLDEAIRPAVIEVAGRRVGMLAYCEGRAPTHPHVATSRREGSAPLDADRIRRGVEALRPQVDVLIVSLHQGVNYVSYASPRQRDFAMAAARAGADVVVGHHPHVMQGAERLRGTLVLHSLGEFLWDPGLGNVVDPSMQEARDRTAVCEVTFAPGSPPQFRMIPFRRNARCLPSGLAPPEEAAFHAWFAEVSAVYRDYDPQVFLEAAGEGVVSHALKVFAFNLRRGNVKYFLGILTRVRGRHLKIAWAHVRRRLRRQRAS